MPLSHERSHGDICAVMLNGKIYHLAENTNLCKFNPAKSPVPRILIHHLEPNLRANIKVSFNATRAVDGPDVTKYTAKLNPLGHKNFFLDVDCSPDDVHGFEIHDARSYDLPDQFQNDTEKFDPEGKTFMIWTSNSPLVHGESVPKLASPLNNQIMKELGQDVAKLKREKKPFHFFVVLDMNFDDPADRSSIASIRGRFGRYADKSVDPLLKW